MKPVLVHHERGGDAADFSGGVVADDDSNGVVAGREFQGIFHGESVGAEGGELGVANGCVNGSGGGDRVVVFLAVVEKDGGGYVEIDFTFSID